MNRFIAALLIVLTACTSGRPAPRQPGAKPPTVTLVARGLTLSQGSSAPAIIGIDAATGATGIIVEHDPDAHVDVYLLPSTSALLPPNGCATDVSPSGTKDCIADIGSGVRETLERPSARAVALVLQRGEGRVNVKLEYDEQSRNVSVRIPRLAQPPGASVCKDNGCNPFFELTPLHAGEFTASARWTGGQGLLQLQAGRVIAQNYSASGLPYRIPAERRGPSPLSIKAELSAPAEYALAFLNADVRGPLLQIQIDARWP